MRFILKQMIVVELNMVEKQNPMQIKKDFVNKLANAGLFEKIPQMVEEADLVIAMTVSHLRQAQDMTERAGDKTLLVTPEGIADPIGQSVEVYRMTADNIQQGLAPLVDRLLSPGGKRNR